MRSSRATDALPRPLFGVIFGGLAPREVDTSARLVCKAFVSVLPVWPTIEVGILFSRTSRRMIRACERSQVRRINAFFLTLGAFLCDFTGLRSCHLTVCLGQLPTLAAEVCGREIDVELTLWESSSAGMADGFQALAKNLVGLSLCELSESVLTVLCCLPLFSRITWVDVSRQPRMSGEGLLQVLALGAPCLERLHCRKCGLDDSHVSLLSCFSCLTELDVSDNEITNVSFVKCMPRLRSLNLNATPLMDLKPLASLHRLATLDLSRRPFADEKELVSLYGLLTLAWLDIRDNFWLRSTTVSELQAALPKCRLLVDHFLN